MNTLILVVDDEPDVLRMIEILLSNSGFEVVPANGAQDAIRAFNSTSHKPDLVLTDVVMPGMSGPMLADRLLAIDPEVRILFMSGYDERQAVQRYVAEKGYRLLVKPFTFQALRQAIAATLTA